MAILIIGLMFASITAAIVSVLSYFASAEQLQQYIFLGIWKSGEFIMAGIGIAYGHICFRNVLKHRFDKIIGYIVAW